MRSLLFVFSGCLIAGITYLKLLYTSLHNHTDHHSKKDSALIKTPNLNTVLKQDAAPLKPYLHKHHFNESICFMIDFKIPSGLKRFFVYDLTNDSVLNAGLVAHGSCGYAFTTVVHFDNKPGCGCSSSGKFKIGYAYPGRFGKSYKLFGLDSSNSNAFIRNVVLHPYEGIPEDETYPNPIMNSLGCPMVAPGFLKKITPFITASKKPILLWILD